MHSPHSKLPTTNQNRLLTNRRIASLLFDSNIVSATGTKKNSSIQGRTYKYKQTSVGFAFLLCLRLKSFLLQEIYQQFIDGLKNTGWMEYVAVFAGIASVWFSRIENILVYPVGLINTIFYIYLSYKYHLPGEASVNLYYTIMSFYGWYMWVKRDQAKQKILHITYSDKRMLLYQMLFFAFFYIGIFLSLTYLKKIFFEGAIPWADAFASATAFTGMWLMTRKKVESWWWWIGTNIASIPLYFVKGLVFTSVYYLVLLILAVGGLMEWKKRAVTKKAAA